MSIKIIIKYTSISFQLFYLLICPSQYRAPYLRGTTMVPPCCVLDRIIDRRFAEKVKVFQCS